MGTLWGGSSQHGHSGPLVEVKARIEKADNEGVTEVVTGLARLEYKWKDLDPQWQKALLKKAIQVYLEHAGTRKVRLWTPLAFSTPSSSSASSQQPGQFRPGVVGVEGQISVWGPPTPGCRLVPTSSTALRHQRWGTTWSTLWRCNRVGRSTI